MPHPRILLLLVALAAGPCPARGQAVDIPPAPPPPADTASASTGSAAESALIARFEAGQLGAEYIVLDSNGGSFLARYEPAADAPPVGALLVVPGFARPISAEPAIDALLAEFPGNGWSVLAVQPKLPPPEAELATYSALQEPIQARLEAACARLQADGITRIVMVGLDGGAGVARRFLAEAASAALVTGFASRGAWEGELKGLERPLIEFVGEFDWRAARVGDQRPKAARRDQLPYRRYTLAGVGVDYASSSAEFARGLRGWVKTTLGDPLSGP